MCSDFEGSLHILEPWIGIFFAVQRATYFLDISAHCSPPLHPSHHDTLYGCSLINWMIFLRNLWYFIIRNIDGTSEHQYWYSGRLWELCNSDGLRHDNILISLMRRLKLSIIDPGVLVANHSCQNMGDCWHRDYRNIVDLYDFAFSNDTHFIQHLLLCGFKMTNVLCLVMLSYLNNGMWVQFVCKAFQLEDYMS